MQLIYYIISSSSTSAAILAASSVRKDTYALLLMSADMSTWFWLIRVSIITFVLFATSHYGLQDMSISSPAGVLFGHP